MKKKKITIKDVANFAGFSASTVSHVINKTRFVEKETSDKILKAIKDLNYRPNILARSLKGKGTKTLGVIISDIREGFFSEIIKSVESNANKCGYSVMLCDSEESVENEKLYIDVLLSKGIDGLIFAPVNTEVVFNDILSNWIPSVQIDRRLHYHKADFVGIDNKKSAETAVRHFYNNGYKNIGFIGYKESVYTMEKRIEGYTNAVYEKKIQNELKIKIMSHNNVNITAKIQGWLNKCKDIDAVLCGNDNICYETLTAIQEIGLRIPEDIGIISFDDSKWFRILKCPVTAIRQPTLKMGEIAVDLLIDKIEKKSSKGFKDILLDPDLIVRQSSLKDKN